MTPVEFAEQMAEVAKQDSESAHMDADMIMCGLLVHLGYGDGVETFLKMRRWYS